MYYSVMWAIEAENLTKEYRMYEKPVDRLKEAVLRKPMHETVRSLENVSFRVPFGQTIGVIGANGSGKSTLLKIIAGTLQPTSGAIQIRGRVAALLELGAGFHTEFTGRENIWLNASLLGLTYQEIREREQSIIDFSELHEFIDRPIKTYSSGMVVRLAFSIATSVDPDILVIDEALSVGDQYFQAKCVDRLMEFKKQGKTILFCSHAMYLVTLLCSQTIWLHMGRAKQTGETSRVTAEYENFVRRLSGEKAADRTLDTGIVEIDAPLVFITKIALNGREEERLDLNPYDRLDVEIEFESYVEDLTFWIAAGIWRNDEVMCHAVSMKKYFSNPLRGKGKGRTRLVYESLPLLQGEFRIVAFVSHESGAHFYHQVDSVPFSIRPRERWTDEIGLMQLAHRWERE